MSRNVTTHVYVQRTYQYGFLSAFLVVITAAVAVFVLLPEKKERTYMSVAVDFYEKLKSRSCTRRKCYLFSRDIIDDHKIYVPFFSKYKIKWKANVKGLMMRWPTLKHFHFLKQIFFTENKLMDICVQDIYSGWINHFMNLMRAFADCKTKRGKNRCTTGIIY